jgi:hypothetical protein
MAEPFPAPPSRDGLVGLGMVVSATSAALSSFDALRDLAVSTGWPMLLAPLLPLTVDAYAMTATRVWLAGSTRSARARRFARKNAVAAIFLSLCGNAVYHLIAAGLGRASWIVVVAVGAVPPLILGLVSHLAVLRSLVDPVGTGPDAEREESGPDVPTVRTGRPAVRTEAGPGQANEDDLMTAARTADVAHQAAHGRPMSRDALRRELHIGGARATALHRRLKDERLHVPVPNVNDEPANS